VATPNPLEVTYIKIKLMCCFFKLIELRLIAIVHQYLWERLSRFGAHRRWGFEKCAAYFSKEAGVARTEVRSLPAEEAKGIRIILLKSVVREQF